MFKHFFFGKFELIFEYSEGLVLGNIFHIVISLLDCSFHIHVINNPRNQTHCHQHGMSEYFAEYIHKDIMIQISIIYMEDSIHHFFTIPSAVHKAK